MNRWMYGFVILLVILSFHLLLSSFRAELIPDNRSTAKKVDYIGLDGEVTTLPIWCSTCALVGTSGHLLERNYGPEIDKHSCIFRLGFSATRGFERFVGSRTTARFVDSFSFFPFLKRPWKLVTGPYVSEAWILFDRRPGDISWYHRPLLSDLVQKHDSKFLWMTKKAEGEVQEFLKKHILNDRSNKVSGLWFSLKVIQDAGCRSLNIYGIPHHQICKRNMNIGVPSLYWNNSSVPLCLNGADASVMSSQSLSPSSKLPTVPERKVLFSWKPEHLMSINFKAPIGPS